MSYLAPSLNIPRSRIRSMENNSEPIPKRSVEQRVNPVPPARRSCMKKTGKRTIEAATKNRVSFDLEKNQVWTIKDWTLPITLQRQEASTAAQVREGWVFDEGGIDVLMTDV